MLKLIANNGFQKEFSHNVTAEIKEIKQTINELRVDFAKNQ